MLLVAGCEHQRHAWAAALRAAASGPHLAAGGVSGARSEVAEAAERACSLLLPGAELRPQPVWLSQAGGGDQAVELLREAVAADQRVAVAVVEDAPHGDRDGLELAGALWEIDPDIQVIASSDRPWPEVGPLLQRAPQRDQLLVLRPPLETAELVQAVLSLTARWRTAAELRTRTRDLQSELDRRVEVEMRLRHKAERDALTQLPNRVVLLERLNEILRRHKHERSSIDALLFLDLDNFKFVNDTYGHHAGDVLLQQVAGRLRSCVRSGSRDEDRTETVRLGGDEFVILLERLKHREDARHIAHRVVERLAEPFLIEGRQVLVGSSVGIAFVDPLVATGEALLQNADMAMYRAKLSGKGQLAIFDRDMCEDINARLEMEAALRQAIRQSQFEVLYQPAYDLERGQLLFFEALMRWRIDSTRSVPPSRFIPIAEQLGLITEIGYWVIERAATQWSESALCDLGPVHPPSININLSPQQLYQPDFPERVGAILDRVGFPRERLKLEINEKVALDEPAESARRLSALCEAGFGICMDDFGAGHSSLAFFHQFPIETLKIDRSFVNSIGENRSHQAIVEAVVRLAHSMEATVVAEGLETVEQVRLLRAMGCDVGQGYYFAQPLSFEEARLRLGESLSQLDWALVERGEASGTLPTSSPGLPLQMLDRPGSLR
jgi:diguanylate cyclase (GGDEF)-like protein